MGECMGWDGSASVPLLDNVKLKRCKCALINYTERVTVWCDLICCHHTTQLNVKPASGRPSADPQKTTANPQKTPRRPKAADRRHGVLSRRTLFSKKNNDKIWT